MQLVSRNGNVYKSFGSLCADMAACLAVQNAILDGEMVHLDVEGKPQFLSLLRRRVPQQFVAFDILWLNGRDVRRMPLLQRKHLLRSVIHGGPCLLYADFVEGAEQSCSMPFAKWI